MSHSFSARAALSRALVVVVVFGSALIGMAGTSLATSVSEVNPSTAGTTVSAGPAIAGVSLATFTWALVGFTLLVLGFFAASRSGRRNPVAATRPSLTSPVAVRSFQPSAHEAQGEPAPAAMTV